MWYIIKTDYYKERDAIKDLLRLDSIADIYFPNSRPKPEDIGWDKKKVSFRPVINGILFAYVKDVKLLLKDLNANGYFLQKEESPNEKRPQVAGNAHLFALEGETEGLKSMLIHAKISDEEIYRYKVCIEQSAVHTDDIKIVGKDYAELAANNDIVMITNGPFVGYTGVIKQVKSHGVKDRCFLFSLGGFCVQLSGIRRYEVIVVKETTKGTKAQLPNTWRYIDQLQGRLQATYFADNSAAVLRNILEQYNKVKDTEKCQALLLEEAKQKGDSTIEELTDSNEVFADPADRATAESDRAFTLRIRDRERRLIRKIQSALQRIDDGTYGICDECGEEIAIPRLKARPVTRLCINCKAKQEEDEHLRGD
mgnify:CR=1 FL=1